MMIKYQQRWYSKAFAMFLALTILIAAPFSTVQAYAMEGAQLTESVNPGDTSPDTISEMDGGVPKEAPLETSEAIDSGRPPEESASPTDAAPAGIGLFGDDTTPPAFDGNPIISPQSKGSRQIDILVKAQEEAYFNAVLLPDGANSPTKEQVIAGQDADGNPALRVYKNNKKEIDMHIVGFVPQHGTEYDVYVVLKDDADNTSEPLKVDFKSPDAVEYFAQDFPMNGAVQPDGSKQVEVKIKLENIDSSKKGKVYWVLLPNEARTPSIEQIAQGTDSNNNPAISSGSPEFAPGINDSFLVTGTVGGTDYDLYMVVGNTYYANPLASCTDVVKLDVTTPPDIEGEKLCEIDGTEYATLQEAMEAAGTTATIKLLKSFTTVQGVIIDRKHITFDLNGQTLTIDTTANEGLKVTEGTVALTGAGKLNATGKLYGVWANKGTVTVDTAASGNDGIGVYAMGGSKVTVRGNATGQDNGVYATDSGTMVKVNGNVTSTDGQIQGAAHAQNQAEVIVGGNVSAISGYGARTSNSGVITVEGDVYGLRAGAFTEGAGGSITVKGDLSSYNHCAVITGDSSGNITVEGTVTPKSSASYVLINNVRLEKDAGVSDPGKSGYLKYSGSGATGVVWVKDPLAAKVWEVSDDEGLENALGSFRDGDTIKLMANINYNQGIAIDGKTVTFDVDGYILNVKNSIENGTGLNVMNGGKVFLTGSGALNVEGYRYGVQVHSNNANSEATVTKATAIGPEGKAAHTNNKAKLTVLGDVTATGNRGSGIHAQQGSLLEVKGNINATNQGVNVSGATAKVTGNVQAISQDPLTGKDIGIGVNVYNGVAEIGGNVTANRVGAMIRAGGSITIDGMITAPAYIEFNDNAPTTIDDYLPETTKVGYRTYSDGKSNVWVKGGEASENVCEIGDVQYATLGEALTKVKNGETIKLLQNITYTDSIEVSGKTINFDLGDYNLFLDISSESPNKPALTVESSGKVNLIGTGTGRFNVKGSSTAMSAISILGANSAATVNNVEGGRIGVYMYGSGPALDGGSITVNGNIKADSGVTVNAKNGQVLVNGNITASLIGVSTWANQDTQVTVNGNITVIDHTPRSEPVGIRAYSGNTVEVFGDVTVNGADCTGVHASGGIIRIDGNMVSSGQGVYCDSRGEVRITGSLTAGTPFIVVGSTEMTADQGTKTGDGFLEYSDSKSTVWIGSVGDSAPAYLLTVVSGTGGGTYAVGAQVPITANPPVQGKLFDKWTTSNGGSFEDANSASTTFTMPSNPVTITATYKDEPIETYTLTVKGSYAENSGAGKYAAGTKVSIHAGSRNNYSFAGWTTSGQGSFTNANSASTTFIMPNSNTTVTANWKYNSGGGESTGGGGGYGSSSGGSSTESPTTQTTILPEKKPDQPVTVAALVTVTAEEKGHANTIISHKLITDAINKAQSYAKEQGKTKNGISTELSLTLPKDTGSLGITLTQGALDKLVNTGVKSFKINGYPVTISFDEKALEEINNQREGNVTIEIKPVQDLNTAAEKVIGKRPVYNITISYLKDGKPILISDLNGGIATITIQYKPDKNEAVGYLYGAYVNERGNANLIDGSAYDINEGEMIISTSYILNHGVGYKEPSSKFIDIENHWAKESIDYVVARALLTGTSETTFAPNMAMTRGMLVTALGRLAGVDEKAYDTNSFIDVNVDSPFRPYIEWAYKKDIVKGIGNQRFAPNRAITREEIAVIFVNYAKATGYRLPIIREVTTYADTTNIGSYYQPAVKAMQQAGIMIGDTKNQFNPKKSATRAEVSSMVQRYIKLTQDPETAYGWALNDAGQYLYYKNSKVLTGMQIIDGVKYFFNTDGSLKTGWVMDGGNWRYYSGNKAIIGWLDISGKSYYFSSEGLMISDKWIQIEDNWYYFYYDGSLAVNTKVDGYEVDKNGVRKTK